MEDIHVPLGRGKMRSLSFINDRLDSHFYLRTNNGEYKKTRWTELGVIRLKEDLADVLNYVEEMQNLIVLLEKEGKASQSSPSSSGGEVRADEGGGENPEDKEGSPKGRSRSKRIMRFRDRTKRKQGEAAERSSLA